ncbi:hypothetical protein M8J76_005014 [Diaphorina citri]|nr:hypothetical protein M8J75_001231 [Diaphorina citri]KAI5729658.1 hypothetical protein M8J76_005014 [Diaphorina citri]
MGPTVETRNVLVYWTTWTFRSWNSYEFRALKIQYEDHLDENVVLYGDHGSNTQARADFARPNAEIAARRRNILNYMRWLG